MGTEGMGSTCTTSQDGCGDHRGRRGVVRLRAGAPEPWGRGGYFLKDQPKLKRYHISVVKPMMMQMKFTN